MIPIDRVYQTILTLANTDVRGNVKPKDARLLINDSVNEIYEELLLDVNRFVNRENRGLINGGLENVGDRTREKIHHFLKESPLTYSTTVFPLPTDLRYFDSVFYNESTEVETAKNAKEFKLVSNLQQTNEDYPIYLRIGNTIKISPNTITDNVSLWYLRKPLVANWTYVVVNDAEIFNPTALDFQDIDMHPSEESNIVLRTCLKAGINLKEQDLQKVMQGAEANQSNQENAS